MNVTAGVGSQLVITLLSFVSRTVFIYTLGAEYLGINGLFTSLLLMLSIAEAGIGSAIIYALYKPVADQDEEKILALMKLYRLIYRVIAIVVFLLGLLFIPLLPFFVQDTHIKQLPIIFLIFLFNTALPYLFQHKISFLNVCQKNYIVTGVYTIATILSTTLKLAVLYWTGNYLLFLVIELVFNVVSAIVLAKLVTRMYPMLKRKTTTSLDLDTRQGIIKNVKAIVLQRIGHYFVYGTDNLMISYFISVVAVGIYSNYVMFIEICRSFLGQVFNNMYHSIGNLVAKESREKIFTVFKATMLVNFWLYSMVSIGLLLILEPFIHLWIGEEYILSPPLLWLLVGMFYERGMRNAITTVKTTAGIFHEDRYVPLCQAALNVGLSLWLVHIYGLSGIFIGTLLSAFLVPFWVTPMLVYTKVFAMPFFHYIKRYVLFTLLALVPYGSLYMILQFIPKSSFAWLVLQGAIVFVFVNVFYCIVFYRTQEFHYLKSLISALMMKMRIRIGVVKKIEG